MSGAPRAAGGRPKRKKKGGGGAPAGGKTKAEKESSDMKTFPWPKPAPRAEKKTQHKRNP